MRIAFAGLRHPHIYDLYSMAKNNPQVEILGCWEADKAAADAAKARVAEKAYESYEALLADDGLDIVAVGDYYGIRASRILQALRAGKNVLCDKPLCTSREDLLRIECEARARGLHVGCMLSLRYDPALRLARALVAQGVIGQTRAVGFTGQHPLQYGKRPGWYFEPGKHGGTINDIAVHGLDAVAMVTGKRFDTPVCARQWNAFAKEVPAFLDCAQFLARAADGAGLTADVSYSAPDSVAFALPSYWRFNFWGDSGMLECRFGGGEVLLADKSGMRRLPAPPLADDELRELIRAIRGEQTFLPESDAFASTREALAMQAAADAFKI